MNAVPNFHFKGDCARAIEMYVKAFGAKVLCMLSSANAQPCDYIARAERRALIYHAEIMIGESRIMMSDIDEIDEYNFGNSTSTVITFDTADEVEAAYNILGEGAQIVHEICSTSYSSRFVSLIDRFGIRWELMTEGTDK